MSYINLKYKPKNDVVCNFFVEPATRNVVKQIAAESSIGTWTDVPKTKRRLGAKVFSIKGKNIRIAYPIELFEPSNVPQLLSSVAGNIFGMKIVKNLRLNDIFIPKEYVKSFKGPKFGISGIRKLVKVRKRPLLGSIIKPKLGLSTIEHAKVAYNAWVGGCDIIKDDENLTNQRFNPFAKRVIETLKMRDKAERKTGEKKIYIPNITAETNEMIKRAKFVQKEGGEYIMVDIITCGFSALQTLRNEDLNLVIHAHRAMHAAITRNKKHGISMLVIAKLSRLIGVDQLHIGTIVGKMESQKGEVIAIKNAMTNRWFDVKQTFPVCSGGLHPGHIPKLVKMLGNDIIIQMGGGIHAHPFGSEAGAKAARQAIDATMKRISLKEYAKENEELRAVIEKWGALS